MTLVGRLSSEQESVFCLPFISCMTTFMAISFWVVASKRTTNYKWLGNFSQSVRACGGGGFSDVTICFLFSRKIFDFNQQTDLRLHQFQTSPRSYLSSTPTYWINNFRFNPNFQDCRWHFSRRSLVQSGWIINGTSWTHLFHHRRHRRTKDIGSWWILIEQSNEEKWNWIGV